MQGGKFANQVGWKKCKQDGETIKNADPVYSFIWHPRVWSKESINC